MNCGDRADLQGSHATRLVTKRGVGRARRVGAGEDGGHGPDSYGLTKTAGSSSGRARVRE